MIIEILSPEACFRTLCALSELHPAQFSPLICRTWSPNRRPARDAGEFAWTNWTNIPCKRRGHGRNRMFFLKCEGQSLNTQPFSFLFLCNTNQMDKRRGIQQVFKTHFWNFSKFIDVFKRLTDINVRMKLGNKQVCSVLSCSV